MARLDTGWHAHPKIVAQGWAAMGLHCWSISYSDYHRTDGFVADGAWPSLPGTRSAVKLLVAAGLWAPVSGGYMVHDYLDYNRSRADIEALERLRRSAGHNGGLAKAKANAIPNAKQNANQTAGNELSNLPPPGSRIPVNSVAAAAGSTPEGGLGETNGNGGGANFDSLPDEVRARLRQRPLRDAQR